MSLFANVTAGSSDPADIYSDLGAEEARVDPRTQPIHCFGGTSGSVNAAAAGTATCTPQGMNIRPDRIELAIADAALCTISAITIGGLPIMHGGTLPGDMFSPLAVAGLRPGIVAGPNNPLVVSLTNQDTAARTFEVGVKGPVMRAGA